MNLINRKDKFLETLISTFIPLLAGFLLGALLLWGSGYDPWSAYSLMFKKVFEDFGLVIGRATPLIFTGLALAIPYSVGLLNLGAEGQIVVGALLGALIGAYLPLPAVLHIPLIMISGAVGGMLCALFCGYLKLKFGASEVVTTVMLNSVIMLLAEYCVNGPLNGMPSQPQTAPILNTAKLPKFDIRADYSVAIFIAVAVSIIMWIFINKTVLGYEMRASGLNLKASRYKGININSASLLAMGIGGLIAGMGGAVEVMGTQYSYYHGFLNNYGYTGMGVALIARNNPIAVIPAAIFLAAIRVGGMSIDRLTPIPSHFIWVLQGMMIIALAIPNMMSLVVSIKNAFLRLFIRKNAAAKTEVKE